MDQKDLAERRGRVDSTLNEHDEKLEEHDKRITRTEKFMYIAIGGLATLSMALGSSELASVIGGF